MEKTKIKILIIRFSSIGDIVLTTPVVRCLKNQMVEDVELHFLMKKQYSNIAENNPNITKVHTIEKSTNEVIAQLQQEQFDYVIDLHKNIRSKRIIKKLKSLSFSFDKLNFRKWWLTTFKNNKLPDIHIVDRYFGAVKTLGIKNDNKGLDYFIPEKDEIKLTELPSLHQSGYIAFAIGAQHFTKRLPVDKMIAICKQINQPIILLGGKEDNEIGARVKIAVGELIFNACGKYNLNQSASLVKQSDKLLTHDTGLMHIGAALGVKIVSVWGNTVLEFGMYPYYPSQPEKYIIIENKELNCRPCSKIGYDKCPKKHFKCMNDIDEKQLVDSLNNL